MGAFDGSIGRLVLKPTNADVVGSGGKGLIGAGKIAVGGKGLIGGTN